MSAPRVSLRRSRFVRGSFQSRFLSRCALCWTMYHLVLFHAMFACWAFERQTGAVGERGVAVPFGALYREFAWEHRALLVGAAVAFPIILWEMLKQTHRIAGPLVRFRETLASMSNGQPGKPVQLRSGDMLEEFEQTFNAFVGVWNARLAVEIAGQSASPRPEPVSEDWSDTAIDDSPLEGESVIRVSNSNVLVVSR